MRLRRTTKDENRTMSILGILLTAILATRVRLRT